MVLPSQTAAPSRKVPPSEAETTTSNGLHAREEHQAAAADEQAKPSAAHRWADEAVNTPAPFRQKPQTFRWEGYHPGIKQGDGPSDRWVYHHHRTKGVKRGSATGIPTRSQAAPQTRPNDARLQPYFRNPRPTERWPTAQHHKQQPPGQWPPPQQPHPNPGLPSQQQQHQQQWLPQDLQQQQGRGHSAPWQPNQQQRHMPPTQQHQQQQQTNHRQQPVQSRPAPDPVEVQIPPNVTVAQLAKLLGALLMHQLFQASDAPACKQFCRFNMRMLHAGVDVARLESTLSELGEEPSSIEDRCAPQCWKSKLSMAHRSCHVKAHLTTAGLCVWISTC